MNSFLSSNILIGTGQKQYFELIIKVLSENVKYFYTTVKGIKMNTKQVTLQQIIP